MLTHGDLSTGDRGAREDAWRWRRPQLCLVLPALTLRPRAEAATAPETVRRAANGALRAGHSEAPVCGRTVRRWGPASAAAAGGAPLASRWGCARLWAELAARGLLAAPTADRGRGCAAAAPRAASLLRPCRERGLRCGRHGGQRGLGSVCCPPPPLSLTPTGSRGRGVVVGRGVRHSPPPRRSGAGGPVRVRGGGGRRGRWLSSF